MVNATRLFTSFMVLPRPSSPMWKVAPERVEHRPHLRDGVVVATHHKHQLAVLGTGRRP